MGVVVEVRIVVNYQIVHVGGAANDLDPYPIISQLWPFQLYDCMQSLQHTARSTMKHPLNFQKLRKTP